MQLFSYLNFKPLYNETNFMASGSKIIGRVFLKENVNIWFNSVLRGDVNEIHVGENTNIQDLCMLHVTEDHNLIIGQNVTIGHSVILHGCEVGDSCLVGMGSHILDGAVIGDHCIDVLIKQFRLIYQNLSGFRIAFEILFKHIW